MSLDEMCALARDNIDAVCEAIAAAEERAQRARERAEALAGALQEAHDAMELVGYCDPVRVGLPASTYRQTIRRQAEHARAAVTRLRASLSAYEATKGEKEESHG